MQRYILNNETKSFSKEDIHHILNVMRYENDDKVTVCYNKKCFVAKLKINSKEVSYEIIDELNNNNLVNVTLLQGNLKGNKLDTTIKYSTMFNVSNIIIADFKRSVARLKNVSHKLERYNKISKEAAELSKRNYVPNISFIEKLENINFKKFDLIILADELENNNTFNSLNINKTFKNILIIIGPEGGISNYERKLFKENGSKTITLGSLILPAEIASIKLLSLINNVFDN